MADVWGSPQGEGGREHFFAESLPPVARSQFIAEVASASDENRPGVLNYWRWRVLSAMYGSNRNEFWDIAVNFLMNEDRHPLEKD